MKCKMLALSATALLLLMAPLQAHEHRMNHVDMMNHMKMELNLTEAQVAQIKPILTDYKDALNRAHDTKMDRLKAVLTDDQMKKLKDRKKEMRKDLK